MPTSPPNDPGHEQDSRAADAATDFAVQPGTGRSDTLGALDLRALRGQWFDELQSPLREGTAGQVLSADLTARWDEIIVDRWSRVLSEGVDSCALYALGGYGRREMAPFSDVDLMVLVPDELASGLSAESEGPVPEGLARVERFIRSLWEDGIKLGHAVRTPSQCDGLAVGDPVVATSLLDSRFLAGSDDELPNPASRVRETLTDEARVCFLERLLGGLSERRRKFGDAAHLLEPQVKTGHGGLRDLQTLHWVARLLFSVRGLGDSTDLVDKGLVSAEENARLEAAGSFLLRTRFALHLHHGWKQDQLTYAAQRAIAAELGFGRQWVHDSIERFMQAFYSHVHTIQTATAVWLEAWTLRDAAYAHKHAPSAMTRARVTVNEPESLERQPERLFAVLDKARQNACELHPDAKRALAQAAPRLPVRIALDARANQTVRAVICDLDDPGDLLWTLANTGVLGRVIPEWAHLMAHAQHDTYHVYTTDVHLLHTCQRTRELLRGDLDERLPYLSRVASRYRVRQRPDALVVAALLHDVGKRMAADHSIIGAGMAVDIARRMGFDKADRTLIRTLIIEHLTMPKVSQRRDLRDRATLRSFCRHVNTKSLLDGLVILSFADMDSVGPRHLNAWKLNLLEELHRAATRYIDTSVSGRLNTRSLPLEQLREVLRDEMAEERVEQVLNRIPHRLAEFADLPLLMRAARLLAGGQDSPGVSLSFHDAQDSSHTEILILEHTHPGRLDLVAGVLATFGLNISSAECLPRRPDGTLNRFLVHTANHRAIAKRRRVALGEKLAEVVGRGGSFEALLSAKLNQSRLPPRQRPDVKTSVMIDNDFDPGFSLIEVKAQDRPGLLAHIAASLSDLALRVDRSIITTEGDRAIDTFYVTDETNDKLDEARSQVVIDTLSQRLRELADSR